jgi:hypothetical protein
MKKNYLIFTLAIVSLAGAAMIYNQAAAYRGDASKTGPNYDPARHEEMLNAFKNNDYTAWKKLMGDRPGRVNQVINESNFEKFAEAHKLSLEGKTAEANAIRQELGLGNGNGSGKGMKGQGSKNGTRANFVDNNKDGICDNRQ